MRQPRIFSTASSVISAAAFCMALNAGCGAPPTPVAADSAPRQRVSNSPERVYLLRGLWDFFSFGLDVLAEKLVAQGVDARAVTGPNWPRHADAIVAGYADGSDTRPLTLVGHSYGSDDAIRLARALNEQGIPVKLLYLLDATDPAPIPPNVDRCVHLYMPNALGQGVPDMFPGNPVVAEIGNDHTRIVNIVFNEEQFGSAVHGVDHFNIEESAFVHDLVIAEVLGEDVADESVK
jgi:pimeloyl-ACP methyl ester carboxylesterase